ncbi:MAG: 4Fe-4S dicluster domain-containing protein [Nitrososphaeria archaeon]
MNTKYTTPFVKIKVGVLRDPCVTSGEATCDSSELVKRIKELHSKAIVIVGVYDDDHLKLYREATIKAGINPILMRVVDYRWGDQYIKQNIAVLEHNWIADMAEETEVTMPVSRREVITGAVRVGKDRIDKPVFLPDRCNGLYRACTICQDSCPYGALSIDKKSGIGINYEKCTSCGLCVSACPTSAIQFPSVSQQSIYDLSQTEGKKVISCYKDQGDSVKLPCIAMLSAEDVVALRSSGELVIKCPGCELSKLTDGIKSFASGLNSIVGGIAVQAPDKNEAAGPVKEFSLDLANVSKRLEVRKLVAYEKVRDLLLYNVEVDGESCTMCESCARWCPTSALRIETKDGKSALTFDPESCTGCKICVNVCPAPGNSGEGKAVRVRRAKSERKTLVEDYVVRCRICGAPVGSRRSLDHVKAVMEGRGMQVDDEWLELCQKHRSEYSFKRMFSINAQFRPRGANKSG